MSEQVLLQFRVDKGLKQEVAEICDELGTDIPTVFRMCMKQIKLERGIPFPTKLPQTMITRSKALEAFESLRQQASDIPEMSLDEINAEIAASRAERKTINEYQSLALRTLNPALSEKDVLINGVMGLCGESGEAIDLVKKHLAQGHPLDREALARELGDVAWYLAETAHAIGYDLETVLSMNVEKLRARYPGGFDTAASLNRED